MSNCTSVTVTETEASLIASLLDLWHAAYEHHNHPNQCECPFCVSMEQSGEHPYWVFSSLGEKVGRVEHD